MNLGSSLTGPGPRSYVTGAVLPVGDWLDLGPARSGCHLVAQIPPSTGMIAPVV